MVELENSRDDLLFELHKLTNPYSTVDRDLLKEYFAPVTELSIQMEKQVTNLIWPNQALTNLTLPCLTLPKLT